MDKDRVEGSAKQVKGAVKETIGKVVGDAKLEGEGKADKTERQSAKCHRRPERRGARRCEEVVDSEAVSVASWGFEAASFMGPDITTAGSGHNHCPRASSP